MRKPTPTQSKSRAFWGSTSLRTPCAVQIHAVIPHPMARPGQRRRGAFIRQRGPHEHDPSVRSGHGDQYTEVRP